MSFLIAVSDDDSVDALETYKTENMVIEKNNHLRVLFMKYHNVVMEEWKEMA